MRGGDRYIEEQDEEAFLYEWGNKGKSLVDDQTRQFEEHMFPLAVVGEEGWSLSNWAQGYEKYWQAEAESRIGDEVVEARYSGSVESTTTRDYQDVKRWFADDEAEPESIGEFRKNPVGHDLRGETKRGTSAYNGIFNTSICRSSLRRTARKQSLTFWSRISSPAAPLIS